MPKELPICGGRCAIVDDDDFEVVSRYAWRLEKKGGRSAYARRDGTPDMNGRRPTVYLHSDILTCPPGMQVDHKNGNGLDCRRSNLRCATREQQARNRKATRGDGLKGIRLVNPGSPRPWQARIGHHNKRISLGCFATKEEAARAYDRAASEMFGEFARLNFPAK